LIKYKQTEDITQAAAFAHAAASFIVEDYGITIPDLKDIEERYESYLAKFIV
jgi:sugar/nucleoside kinase (ribokinase family)